MDRHLSRCDWKAVWEVYRGIYKSTGRNNPTPARSLWPKTRRAEKAEGGSVVEMVAVADLALAELGTIRLTMTPKSFGAGDR